MPFNQEQVKQLLAPINPRRVLKDGKGNAHVAANDIIGHLIRIFGFGGFDIQILSVDLLFETERTDKPGRWDVAYKAIARLTVKDEYGDPVASYEDGSTGSAQNQSRHDAHDLAMKSAISLSIKRAAKDLGDQYGLSLYSHGQMTALVKATLVGSPEVVADVQADVEQVVSMGNDEIDTPVVVEPEAEPEVKPEPAAPKTTTKKPAASPKDAALQALKDLAGSQTGGDPKVFNDYLKRVNAKYLETYKCEVKDGQAEDIKAFHALLKTGAITL